MQLTDAGARDARRQRGQGAAEGDGTARALRRGARRRALRRHGQRRGRAGLVEPVPAEPLPQAAAAATMRSSPSSTSTATSWSRCRRRSRHTCHLQGGYDPDNWQVLGATPEAFQHRQRERSVHRRTAACSILKTCTPYLAGNVPQRGDHCAWMESSAVVYCNSVLGAAPTRKGARARAPRCSPAGFRTGAFTSTENRHGTAPDPGRHCRSRA